jgi:salicylate hydroxylase
VYEKTRKQRAETVQQSGTENRVALHLADGPAQLARDEQFLASATGSNPDKWNDRETQTFLWGWDAEKVALDAWNGTQFRLLCCSRNTNSYPTELVKGEKMNASL